MKSKNDTAGYLCYKCGSLTCIIDSRRTHLFGVDSIRRRRLCLKSKCKRRSTTYEIPEKFIGEVEAGRKILAALCEAIRLAASKNRLTGC